MEQTLSVAAAAETMIVRRRRIFLGFVLGFGIWQASQVINDLLPILSPWRGGVIGVGLLGWAVWTIFLFRFNTFIKELKRNRPVSAVLQDELAQQTHDKALRFAFGITLTALCLIRAVVSFHAVPATAAVDAIVLVAVVAYVAAFLVLDRG